MTATRLVRRVTRATSTNVAAKAAVATTEAEVRKLDEGTLEVHLQSIAEANKVIAAQAKLIEQHEAGITAIMKLHKMDYFSNGVLEASYAMSYSNEKTEINPAVLFKHKSMKADKRAPFFACVKVQIGKLGKFMAENEIKAIAVRTPPAKQGMALTIKAVKPEVVTKPKGRGR